LSIALFHTSSPESNRSVGNKTPYLIPELRGKKIFQFFPIDYGAIFGLFIYGVFLF
jgi:hypothetical protein